MKRKLNKKGFTLVEIIAVIAILALIIILVVPNITKSSEGAKQKAYETKVSEIEDAAELYVQDHFSDYVKKALKPDGSIDESVTANIKVKELYENNYIDADDNGNILDPRSNESLNDMAITITVNIKNKKVEAKFDENKKFEPDSASPSENTNTIISFTLNGVNYEARDGMTWAEWTSSSYNTSALYVKNNLIVSSSSSEETLLLYEEGNKIVYASDKVYSNRKYYVQQEQAQLFW